MGTQNSHYGMEGENEKIIKLILTCLSGAVNNLGQHTRFWHFACLKA